MLSDILKAYWNRIIYPEYPICVVLYLTNICNLRCSFCEIGLANADVKNPLTKYDLNVEKINKIINLCVARKIRRIYLTGGEPFLSKNIWFLLRECQKNSISIESLTSNGSLLKQLSADQIILISSVVKDIVVSIDDSSSIAHDSSRGASGTFLKLENFFQNEDKRQYFKSSFSFNTVIHEGNYKNTMGIIDLAKKWNIKHINFQPVSIDSIFPDMSTKVSKDHFVNKLDIEIFIKIIREAQLYALNNNVSTNLQIFAQWAPHYFAQIKTEKMFFENCIPRFTCSRVYNYVHINYNGDLIPCTNLKSVCNIEDVDYFEKWQKSVQKLKLSFRENKYFPQCRSCYCDFPSNLRFSLLYFPFSNINYLLKLFKYYFKRRQ